MNVTSEQKINFSYSISDSFLKLTRVQKITALVIMVTAVVFTSLLAISAVGLAIGSAISTVYCIPLHLAISIGFLSSVLMAQTITLIGLTTISGLLSWQHGLSQS
jgi:hypothetical protein